MKYWIKKVLYIEIHASFFCIYFHGLRYAHIRGQLQGQVKEGGQPKQNKFSFLCTYKSSVVPFPPHIHFRADKIERWPYMKFCAIFFFFKGLNQSSIFQAEPGSEEEDLANPISLKMNKLRIQSSLKWLNPFSLFSRKARLIYIILDTEHTKKEPKSEYLSSIFLSVFFSCSFIQ